MKRKQIVLALLVSLFLFAGEIFACTNLIVTKGASTDGSVMVTYSADSFAMYGELYHYPAAVYPNGSMLQIYEWDTGKYLGKIKQAPFTYNVIGNMNEHQLVIGETTFGGREELSDPKAIMDYGSLIYVTLQRAKTAREAIKVMSELVTEYGYYSSGESFSIADKNEAWIMEMISKGEGNKGAIWVAVRIPDGYVSGHANQARITKFPLNDPENCIYAKDIITFAKEKGYFTGSDNEFSFAAAYDPITFATTRICDGRVWSMFRRINKDMDKYYSYINGESTERMPLYIKPDKKISVHDVMGLMRDHYEGTPMDMTKGVAAGPYGMPYRWRPVFFECDKERYFHERPISTPQTGFSFVSQSRSHMPDEVGGVLWFGMDDTYMTVYTPLYTNMTRIPAAYGKNVASLSKFSWDSAFWIFNFVSNYAYPKYSLVIDDIRTKQNELEGGFFSQQETIEKTALALLKSSRGEAVEYLTKYSNSCADHTLKTWKTLGENLVCKYMDGIKRDEFAHPVNVGYPEDFRRLIVEKEGARIKMKEFPNEKEDRFKGLVIAGDEYLNNKKYEDAKKSYTKALEIKPGETSLTAKVEKLNKLIAEIQKLHSESFSK